MFEFKVVSFGIYLIPRAIEFIVGIYAFYIPFCVFNRIDAVDTAAGIAEEFLFIVLGHKAFH